MSKTTRRFIVATSDDPSMTQPAAVRELLRKVRETFAMDVVFVSEFRAGQREFWCVDAAPGESDVVEGAGDPAEESFCLRVVDGRLPQLMTDAVTHPVASTLPATHAVRVGAHLSVPVVLKDGETFGTLCCFSHQARPELVDSDLEALRAVAALIAMGIDKHGRLRPQLWAEAKPARSSRDCH